MMNPFDPFEFQLNLGTNTQTNQPRLISMIITPLTNVQQAVQNICTNYNIRKNLIGVIAQTIYTEIQNQVQQKQSKRSLSKSKAPNLNPLKNTLPSSSKKKSSSPFHNNKTKNFKNRFCSYLMQSPAKPVKLKQNNKSPNKQFNTTMKSSDAQTFRNSEDFIDPSMITPSEEQYSFRPNCIETMDLTSNSFQNSFEITQPPVISMSRCSYSTNYTSKNHKKSSVSQKKMFKTKTQKTVFDNLYQHSVLLNMKKQIDRNKSFQKLTFKPQLNPMSKKIVQKKMLNNPEKLKNQKTNELKNKMEPMVLRKSKYEQKSLSKSKCTNKQNRTPQRSVSGMKKMEKEMSIYERGVLFRKKSQDKLSRMKEKQFYEEIKSCSFQPTFYSRKSVHQSRLG